MSRGPFTFYEFFAGGGMARLGLGDSWRCSFANDFDPIKAATYRANFGGDHFVEGDIFDLTPDDLPGVADLAWSSSPCQDFSLAGGRAGLAGGRSSALLGFWRMIEGLATVDRAPRVVVVENVTGLLTSHGGRDFAAICRGFANQGYRFGAVEIDAAAFVPQSRRRVFLIATRREAPAPPGIQAEGLAVAKAFAALPDDLKPLWLNFPAPSLPARNTDLAAILEPDDRVAWRTQAQTSRLVSLMDDNHRAKLRTAQQSGERKVGAVFRRVRSGVQRAEVRFDGVAGCLRTPRGGSSRQAILIVEQDSVRGRLLSPRETARLMGLPDSYRLPSTTTSALQVTGDGVATPVVRWLAGAILEPLLGAPDKLASKKVTAA